MIALASVLVPAALTLSVPALANDTLPPGVWTNTEDVYFAEEEGREKAADVMIEVAQDTHRRTRWRWIDAFGAPRREWSEAPIPGLTRREGGSGGESGWQVGQSEIRKARAFSCWVSTRKFADEDDGSADWTFTRGLITFDQGGRVFVDGKGEAPDITFRLRNVTWAKGSRNRPSFVLYVHKDDPVRAVSYSWASPDAKLIGINLRWVQGSWSLSDENAPGGEAR